MVSVLLRMREAVRPMVESGPEETGGGAGGEHFYDGEGNQGGGEAGGFQEVFEEGCEGI